MNSLGLRELVVIVLIGLVVMLFVSPALAESKKEVEKPAVDVSAVTVKLLDMLDRAGAKAAELGEKGAEGAGKAAVYAWPRLVLFAWGKALGSLFGLLLLIGASLLTCRFFVLRWRAYAARPRSERVMDGEVPYIAGAVLSGLTACVGVVILATMSSELIATLLAPEGALMYELLQKIKF